MKKIILVVLIFCSGTVLGWFAGSDRSAAPSEIRSIQPIGSTMFLDRRFCVYVKDGRITATPPWIVSACVKNFDQALKDLGDGFAEWTDGWPLYSTLLLDGEKYRVTSIYTDVQIPTYGLEKAFPANYVDKVATADLDYLLVYKDQDWKHVPWRKK
mgnify:CR=1 FL=1